MSGTSTPVFTTAADVVAYFKSIQSGSFVLGQETYADMSDVAPIQAFGFNPGLVTADLYRDGANTFLEEDPVPNLIKPRLV